MGQIGLQQPQMAQAAAALRQFAERAPLPAIQSALKYLEQGQTLAAELVLSTILELRSAAGPSGTADAVAAAVLMGDLMSLRRPDEAVAVYLATIAMDPHAADVWNHMGEVLGRLTDLRGAERSYREALRLATEQRAWDVMAYAYESLGNVASDQGDRLSANRQWSEARAMLASWSYGRLCAAGSLEAENFRPLFLWAGPYWGALVDGFVYDAGGRARGFVGSAMGIYRFDGVLAGTLVEGAYVLRRRGVIPSVPRNAHLPPPSPRLPSRWPNRYGRDLHPEERDSLPELP